jgi:transcriptional regulator with XRE-family HTH domain
MRFGQKILNLRTQRGLSQRDLAREIGGISGSSVGAWENGATPAMDAAFRAAQVLGVSLDFLADDSLDEPKEDGMTVAERQLLAMAQRHGAERLLLRLEEVGVGVSIPASSKPGQADVLTPVAFRPGEEAEKRKGAG